MNLTLKIKIIQLYRTQADFAMVAGERESIVSRVVRGRRALPPDRQIKWAELLKCDPKEIFNESKWCGHMKRNGAMENESNAPQESQAE